MHYGGGGMLLGVWDDVWDDKGVVGEGPASLAQKTKHVIGGRDLNVVESTGDAFVAVNAQSIHIHGPVRSHSNTEIAQNLKHQFKRALLAFFFA
jgi:hypothetical protein